MLVQTGGMPPVVVNPPRPCARAIDSPGANAPKELIRLSMRVAGSADLVRRFDDAPDGALMSVEGLVDIESRYYLLRSVVIGSTPPS